MDLREKAEKLHQSLTAVQSLLVAYSGGTDSAFLAYCAHQELGDRMLAVIADSASLPRKELAAALEFTASHNIPTQILHTGELENANYAKNDAQRCFHCKDELFTQMEKTRSELGFERLAYGMNLDDRGEFRPGQQAAKLHNALAPLVEAELTKSEIRELARAAGLNLADKPASACLSSRIEYGRPVTQENLAQVERAEDALSAMGFRKVRVRHHGDLARVEIAREDLPRALNLNVLNDMTDALKACGFRYTTLDTQGYRTGSMNEILPVAAIARASN